MQTHLLLRSARNGWSLALLALLLLGLVHIPVQQIAAEGSDNLIRDGTGARDNLEWRDSAYGEGLLLRRKLLKVYERAGEYLLMGSSAVDVPDEPDLGDIRVYAPGLITGEIGQAVLPP